MKTELNDRVLWHDGTNQVNPEMVPSLFALGVSQDKIVVTSPDADIDLFNQLSDVPLSAFKTANLELDSSWNIPEFYANIDLETFLEGRLAEKMQDNYDRYAHDAYGYRLYAELREIKERDVELLFKTIIYIVDTLRANNQVWGVGRGSSCASLVLYLIGVHEVDPIKYNIPLTEFFHDD